jgi:hypothetical protein
MSILPRMKGSSARSKGGGANVPIGPTRTCGDVRIRAAVKDIADIL